MYDPLSLLSVPNLFLPSCLCAHACLVTFMSAIHRVERRENAANVMLGHLLVPFAHVLWMNLSESEAPFFFLRNLLSQLCGNCVIHKTMQI